MKALTFGSLLVMLCSFVMANNAESEIKTTGEISGKIIDGSTNSPISFATVALMRREDSVLVTGAISDSAGDFLLADLPFGNYNVKASFVGYKPTQAEQVTLNRQNRKVRINELRLLEDITALKEVVVSEERLKGEERIDRTVFTINDDLRKTSTNGLDLLKHIPSVTVDFMDNVTLSGRTDIQFYVDGVLRNKDFVAQLNPESIDKVEVISNPGVKYDSDISGVINIVLKKEKKQGVNGSVTAVIPNPDKIVVNPAANLEYGNQKFRAYAGDRMHYERFPSTENLYTELDSSYTNPYKTNKTTTGISNWQSNYMNYGVDFFVSDKTSLNFLGEWERQRGRSDDFVSTSIKEPYNTTIPKTFTKTLYTSTNTRDNYFYSMFFRQKTDDKGNELTAEATYYRQGGDIENDYIDYYYPTEDWNHPNDSVQRWDKTINNSNTIEFKTDYSFNFKNIKNEAGIRTYSQWMNNENRNGYKALDQNNELTQVFEYGENRQAAYYNLTGKLGKYDWQTGLRGEFSQVTIEDTTQTQYSAFLPQLSISRGFEKNQNVKFSYRRKITRPYISDLNPFVNYMDSLHLRRGNPNLKPSLDDELELTYSVNFGSNFVSPKIYMRYTKNAIGDLSIINEQGITEIWQDNIGKSLEYGTELNASVQVLKKLRVNANAALYYKEVSSDQNLSLDEDNQMLSYRTGGTIIYQLPKDFSLFTFAYYNSRSISYQREFSRDLLALVGFEKSFGQKAKLTVVYNPFIKDFTYAKVITRAPGYNESWEGIVDAQNLFFIEFTYNFSYGGKVNKIDRSIDYQKDKSGGTL